jgi:exodeoxyribonuclease-5
MQDTRSTPATQGRARRPALASPASPSAPPPDRPAVELSREQRDAVARLIQGVKDGEKSQTLGGYAGTGKTTIISSLIGESGRQCAVVAYTNRAARVLQKKGVPATTIHRLLYKPITECGGECQKKKLDCRCKIIGWSRNPALPCSLVVVDEASMVPRDLHRDLMSYGIPCIFVGDHGQLPPIQKKGEEPFNLMESPDIRLEQIHRNAGEIARFAEHLRNGEPAFRFRPRDGTVQICGKGEPLDRLPVMRADRIVCARNATRVGINAYHRRTAGRVALVEPGELVMCLKNDRDRGLSNGTLATVLAVAKGTIDIDSEEGPFSGVPYDPDQFGRAKERELRFGGDKLPFDYGYCSTAHKSQGGEWPFVLVVEEYLGDHLWEHRRWAYTAASRAQSRLVWRASTTIYYPSYDHDREGGGAG